MAPLVVLRGGGTTYLYRGGDEPVTTWTSHAVPLDVTLGWSREDGSTPVTSDNLHRALRSLTGIWIRGEFVSGVDDGWLDNVSLSATPVGW